MKIIEEYNNLICNSDISINEIENRRLFEMFNAKSVDNISKSDDDKCYEIFNSIHVYADELRDGVLNKKLNYQNALIELKTFWVSLYNSFCK